MNQALSERKAFEGENFLKSRYEIPFGVSERGVEYVYFDSGFMHRSEAVSSLAVLGGDYSQHNLLLSILINGCREYASEEIEFWLFEQERGQLTSHVSVKDFPHVKHVACGEDDEQVDAFLIALMDEIDRRQALIKSQKGWQIAHYNRNVLQSPEGGAPLNRIVVCMQGFDHYMLSKASDKSRLLALTAYLSNAVHAAKFGIHLVFTLSNPTMEEDKRCKLFHYNLWGYLNGISSAFYFTQFRLYAKGKFQDVFGENDERCRDTEGYYATDFLYSIPSDKDFKRKVQITVKDEPIASYLELLRRGNGSS